ncbi:SWIM zinc finger family protein [Parachitinimonas caeni]|uniref:SWIM zinc finger family protein n=1 Tax=Parachitinimonas caeni TaxID=3031301 RepID=A0ABT7DYE5_9NEIS|nr:SWIM zinc finger family protein [Parachitinimonas caeni]MDK2125091.1 SWIM zinc finger family protein [Parachitinimonas caeni]
MQFEYRYYGESQVRHDDQGTGISFAPDTLRQPVHFVADISRHLPFREAISALHDVVVSDLRTKQRDVSAYKAWLAGQEQVMLAEFMAQASSLRGQVEALSQQIAEVRTQRVAMQAPYLKAKQRYFNHIYQHNRDLWFVLDPVITVHPDRVFFECFSQDESTYANFSCGHEMFSHHGDFACGTTNIDYSAPLYAEFQKIRQYKPTRLTVEPAGFTVQTGVDDGFVEEKIDLPESWVRGFLQVSAAMALPGRRLQLHPMDLHNFCLILRWRKERVGPRSIRFELVPGQPVKAVFEPWGQEVVCLRSSHDAPAAESIRIWGRRRLLTLERLTGVAERVQVHLLGTGLPSFWMVSGADWQYTLGLSGWTANDWSRNGQFDLFGPRQQVDTATQAQVFQALASDYKATAAQLGLRLGLQPSLVESSLLAYTQAGRVVYDLADGCYRLRELSREPLPLERLRFCNEREEQASQLVSRGKVKGLSISASDAGRQISAQLQDGDRRHGVTLQIDLDERMAAARCDCDYYVHNKLYRGPCAHILAARMAADLQARQQRG